MFAKRVLIIMLGLSVLLTACGGGQTASPTTTPAPNTPTASVPNTPAASAPVVAQTVDISQPSEFKLDPAVACQPYSGVPEAVPGLSPVTPDDWVKGNASATVVLMEYGDYQ